MTLFLFPLTVHFISIKPVLCNHLSYVNKVHCSFVRSHTCTSRGQKIKILIAIQIYEISKNVQNSEGYINYHLSYCTKFIIVYRWMKNGCHKSFKLELMHRIMCINVLCFDCPTGANIRFKVSLLLCNPCN